MLAKEWSRASSFITGGGARLTFEQWAWFLWGFRVMYVGKGVVARGGLRASSSRGVGWWGGHDTHRDQSILRHTTFSTQWSVVCSCVDMFQVPSIPNLVKCSYVLIHISDVYNSAQHQENEWLGFKPWEPDYINTPYTYTR